MSKIIVGLSGGVDSAVAARLLLEAGHDVVGVTLRTGEGESRCCEIDDARESARVLGIPYHVFNCVSAFEREVVAPFIEGYIHGLTPNPCVVCNRRVKWERLLHYAAVLGADKVATGHYACVERLANGRFTVRKAAHAEKDQTYMLYDLTQEQLAATVMPLGALSKREVRRLAAEIGLPVAEKPDSQEICFVPSGHYADFIAARAPDRLPGEGRFVDEEGRVLGVHRGVARYTVGQRKGLGIALGRPVFVKEIRPATNEVVLSGEEALFETEVICRDVNWMAAAPPAVGRTLACRARVRYQGEDRPALLEVLSGAGVRLTFEEAVRAPAPGQSAVFYDDRDRVIGGGVIQPKNGPVA